MKSNSELRDSKNKEQVQALLIAGNFFNNWYVEMHDLEIPYERSTLIKKEIRRKKIFLVFTTRCGQNAYLLSVP